MLIDRFIVKHNNEDDKNRIADSVNTAFYEGDGECIVEEQKTATSISFSNKFELDGIAFEEPSVHLFSFNNPYGACKNCEGFGNIIGIDEDMVVPDKSLSVYDGVIACWRGEKMQRWKDRFVMNAYKFNFPIHRPFYELTEEEKALIWTGNKHVRGLNAFLKYIEKKSYKIQYRVMLSRYRGKTTCPECNGTRLRKDASYVKIAHKSIIDIVLIPVSKSLEFFLSLKKAQGSQSPHASRKGTKLSKHDESVAKRLLIEITNRLEVLCEVGLGYLTLNRLSSTLSGGESQRINLATSLGSCLVGSMYILDEPTIGLHPRDTRRLIKVLDSLKNIGNTVIVVEHDEEIMRAADQLIDIGPMAGSQGGEVVSQGNLHEILNEKKSITAQYLNGTMQIEIPKKRRQWKNFIEVKGARENNLKAIDVKFPLNVITVVTGVSGSGKSSLVKNILFSSLKKIYGGYGKRTGLHDRIEGDINNISNIEFVDQHPIGKSSRSNPVTYLKAFDDIRTLFAEQQLSKIRGYKPAHFSFNVPGGRCEECEGEGKITIEMQFMADLHLVCENCKGKRFKEEILEIEYKGKNIDDILNLTVDEAIEVNHTPALPPAGGEGDPTLWPSKNKKREEVHSKINRLVKNFTTKIKPLQDVGLGYIQLGQPSSTLSGGEAQRVKLATFLGHKKELDTTRGTVINRVTHLAGTLFIFDEPTTGLHFHDINKLLGAFNALIEQGHSIIIIEHNPEIIKNADWVIDLGPDGGDEGGNIVFEGTPEDLINCKSSYTGLFLKKKMQLLI
ncbi:MAG: excinuclease ABC subunit UvrA [Bacteroidota bacterium]